MSGDTIRARLDARHWTNSNQLCCGFPSGCGAVCMDSAEDHEAATRAREWADVLDFLRCALDRAEATLAEHHPATFDPHACAAHGDPYTGPDWPCTDAQRAQQTIDDLDRLTEGWAS